MPYQVLQSPDSVFPGEVQKECPEAEGVVAILIQVLAAQGPSPEIYSVKTLGKEKGYLWQINLKVEKRQVRVLYAPYGQRIVLFRIHKKGSPQEQQRAYDLAMRRKKEFEEADRKLRRDQNGRGVPH
ncbi:MAG TPA: hypothetical protein VFA80_18120 [Xanthobacteraceae bacterium]|nr:hypothetical protein [Xanthobacteraceae bacterium]